MERYLEIFRRKFTNTAIKAVVLLCCTLIMLFAFYIINSTMRFTTIIIDGTETAHVYAPINAQSYTLDMADVTIIPQDKVELTQNENGFATIDIERAFEVTIKADGQTHEFLTVEENIGEFLANNGFDMSEHDYTYPADHHTIKEDTVHIELHRVDYVQYEVDEVIPYDTIDQYTSLFYQFQDYVKVIQEGQDGYFKGIMEDKIVNGEVVETTQISVEEHAEPVPEILKSYGAGVPVSDLAAPDGITVENLVPSSYSTVYEMKATGYYSATGKGSSGLGLYYGTFAVDPTLIPYGTKVYIVSTNGKFIYGWAIATDTGAFINTNRMQVDLFYETYSESAANGVQQVYVYVP